MSDHGKGSEIKHLKDTLDSKMKVIDALEAELGQSVVIIESLRSDGRAFKSSIELLAKQLYEARQQIAAALKLAAGVAIKHGHRVHCGKEGVEDIEMEILALTPADAARERQRERLQAIVDEAEWWHNEKFPSGSHRCHRITDEYDIVPRMETCLRLFRARAALAALDAPPDSGVETKTPDGSKS